MIDSLVIKGYKSIKTAKVDFRAINILIGANGSGKSNFISFFQFLNHLFNQSLSEYVSLNGGPNRFLFQGNKITGELSAQISFNNRINGYSIVLKPGESSFIFTQENLAFKGNIRNISNFGSESLIKFEGSFRAKYIRDYLNSFLLYHFHDTGKQSPFNQTSSIENDIYYLYEKGENLASYLFHIRENHRVTYKRIVRTIQSIAPFFSDFYLTPNQEGYVRLQWKDKYSSMVYGVNDLSDGTIRFIALSVLFLQPNLPKVLIIDEPELGLHPFAVSKLAGVIQSASNRGCKIILATQSSDLISYFLPEDIIAVDLENGESQFNRLDQESLTNWLDDYSLGDLWKRSIISNAQP